jgi:hypothetical protein
MSVTHCPGHHGHQKGDDPIARRNPAFAKAVKKAASHEGVFSRLSSMGAISDSPRESLLPAGGSPHASMTMWVIEAGGCPRRVICGFLEPFSGRF